MNLRKRAEEFLENKFGADWSYKLVKAKAVIDLMTEFAEPRWQDFSQTNKPEVGDRILIDSKYFLEPEFRVWDKSIDKKYNFTKGWEGVRFFIIPKKIV